MKLIPLGTFFLFRALEFPELTLENETLVYDPVEVETVGEVVVPFSEIDFTEEDGIFFSEFFPVVREEMITYTSADDEHKYYKDLPDTADVQELRNAFCGSNVTKTFLEFISKDSDIHAYTNIPTLRQFEELAALLDSVLVQTNYSTVFKLDMREMLLLCLIKLKLNLTFKCLAVMFRISATTTAAYFNFIIDLLYKCMPVPWPPQEIIRRNLPYCFRKKFNNTRVILDCSETSVETPSCASCRIKIYSHYKGGSTVKFLIGIAPNGLIIFISKMYGGRASDSFIVRDCGILEKMEFSDAVMVDKGFLIEEDCNDFAIELIQPPFLRQQQHLKKLEAEKNEMIASARVHVERAIQRIKLYSILKHKLPWELVGRADQILHVVCSLVNLQNPIIDPNRVRYLYHVQVMLSLQ